MLANEESVVVGSRTQEERSATTRRALLEAGRQAIIELLKATMRTRDYVESGEKEGKTLLDAMRDGGLDGMQYFDGELEKLVRDGSIAPSTAYLYATNAGNLRVALADVPDDDSEIIR